MESKRPFYQLVIGWLVVVTVITAIALLRPSPVLSDVDLTQAVNSAFLARTEDPALHDRYNPTVFVNGDNYVRQRRTVEITMRKGKATIKFGASAQMVASAAPSS